MLTQACFLGQSVARQNANIAQEFQSWIGTDLNLSCASSDALSRWYVYSAVATLAEDLNLDIVTLSSIASGTAYTLTNAYASLDFGTTDPVITFDRTGQYLITADVQTAFAGATFAALQSMTFKLRRTNNTATDIGIAKSAVIPIMTTTTLAGPSVRLSAIYSATAGDIVTIQGLLSVAPSAGSVTVTAAQIVAVPNR